MTVLLYINIFSELLQNTRFLHTSCSSRSITLLVFERVSYPHHSRLLVHRGRTRACGARTIFISICTKCAKRILCIWKSVFRGRRKGASSCRENRKMTGVKHALRMCLKATAMTGNGACSFCLARRCNACAKFRN